MVPMLDFVWTVARYYRLESTENLCDSNLYNCTHSVASYHSRIRGIKGYFLNLKYQIFWLIFTNG